MRGKVLNLKPLKNHPELYSFNLMLDGFIVNGFVFVPEREGKKASVMGPTYGPRKVRLVRARGIMWKRLIEQVKELLEQNVYCINTH